MGSSAETQYIRLDPVAADRRALFQYAMSNGCGYNYTVLQPAGTTDPLLPVGNSAVAGTFTGDKYYSIGIRCNIRVSRLASEDGSLNNFVVGYTIYTVRKNAVLPDVTIPTGGGLTGLTFFPVSGVCTTTKATYEAAVDNNSRAVTEPKCLFHRYTTLSEKANTNIVGNYTYTPGTPGTVSGWPAGINPWLDGARHPRINVVKQGIIMRPVMGLTSETAKQDTAYKSLWFKTKRHVDVSENASDDVQLQMLRNTYLAVWAYNPAMNIGNSGPQITMEWIHYFKDV